MHTKYKTTNLMLHKCHHCQYPVWAVQFTSDCMWSVFCPGCGTYLTEPFKLKADAIQDALDHGEIEYN